MYDLLSWFFQPYPLLLTMIGVALWRLRRASKEHYVAWCAAFTAYVALCTVSTAAFSHLVLRAVESGYPQRVATPRPGDVMVVLTGSVLREDALRPYSEPAESALFRCHHAARVYRARPCPIIITGGTPDPTIPGRSNSAIMRDCLVQLGVPAEDIQIEERSLTTAESARECRPLLSGLRAKRAILVTESYHMRRTMLAFKSLDLPLEPAPCAMRAAEFRWSWRSFLPSASALSSLHVGTHEVVGLVWYQLKYAIGS